MSLLKYIFYGHTYFFVYILLCAPVVLVVREFEPIRYDIKMLINIATGAYLLLAVVLSTFSADQVTYYDLAFTDAFLAPYRYLLLVLKKDEPKRIG